MGDKHPDKKKTHEKPLLHYPMKMDEALRVALETPLPPKDDKKPTKKQPQSG